MALISISTSNFVEKRQAEIDGHIFTVRRIGAGDQLDISQASTAIASLSEEAMNLQAKLKNAKGTEEQLKFAKESGAIIEKINKAQKALENCYARLFDDGGDQSKSKELIHAVGAQNAVKILDQIFEASND